jgi:hypothetical protein
MNLRMKWKGSFICNKYYLGVWLGEHLETLLYFQVGYFMTLSVSSLYSIGDWWMRFSWWNDNWHGKAKNSEKIRPSVSLVTNPIWPDLRSNAGLCGGKPATNSLSYGSANLNHMQDCSFIKAQRKQWIRSSHPANFSIRNTFLSG